MIQAISRHVGCFTGHYRLFATFSEGFLDRKIRRDRSAFAKTEWYRKGADATSADLIGNYELQNHPHSALADFFSACKWLYIVARRNLNRSGRGFVTIYI